MKPSDGLEPSTRSYHGDLAPARRGAAVALYISLSLLFVAFDTLGRVRLESTDNTLTVHYGDRIAASGIH